MAPRALVGVWCVEVVGSSVVVDGAPLKRAVSRTLRVEGVIGANLGPESKVEVDLGGWWECLVCEEERTRPDTAKEV